MVDRNPNPFHSVVALCATGFILFSVSVGGQQSETSNSEKIAIVFNQPEYSTADTVFYAVYMLENGELDQSRQEVLILSLVSDNEETVLESRIKLTNGLGNSQFILPEGKLRNRYYLIAQTFNNVDGYQFVGYLKFPISSVVARDQTRTKIKPESIKIITDKTIYRTREEIQLRIKQDGQDSTTSVFSSIAVYKSDLFKDQNDLITPVYFLNESADSVRIVSNLKFPKNSALPSNLFFRGQVLNKSTGMPIEKICRIVFYLNNNDFTYQVNTKQGGWFEFPLFKNFGDETIFYQVYQNNNLLTGARLILENQSFQIKAKDSHVNEANMYLEYARKRRTINESFMYYVKKQNTERKINSGDFVECDYEVKLDKFIDFASMDEVFLNVVPNVKVRQGKEIELRIFLEKTATYGKRDPIFIVNGLMTDSTKYVLGLDPASVGKIGVLRSTGKLLRFGNIGDHGIIVIETKIRGSMNHNSSHSFSVNGIDKPLKFSNPKYTSEKNKTLVPDLRPSIYWNPQIKLPQSQDELLTFFSSDDTGTYIVDVFGLSVNGKIIRSQKQISVSRHK